MWATEPHADLPVKMGSDGAAARPATTVFKVFQKAVEDYGEKPALKFKDTAGVSREPTIFFTFLFWGGR